MAQGLQIFKANGEISIDTDSYLHTILGYAAVYPNSSTVIVNDMFTLGNLWYYRYNPYLTNPDTYGYPYTPPISISLVGNTLTLTAPNYNFLAAYFIYGIL